DTGFQRSSTQRKGTEDFSLSSVQKINLLTPERSIRAGVWKILRPSKLPLQTPQSQHQGKS
ncbi:hypothetical protein ILYODFUR_012279, partial [Ilyodon furcidens]